MSSDLFQIGASGTRAYQAAMGAIADNIANASTPGYSRRTLALGESPAGTSPTIFYRSSASFAGVQVNSVVRAADPYLDAAARATSNTLGSADQRARWMNDIQTALNDNTLGVGQRFTAMFSAVERLASNPTDTTLRADVLFSFEQINTAFKQSYDDLTTIRSSIGSSATNEMAALNDALKQLAVANEGLRRTPEGSASHVSLEDARDLALGEVVKRLNVTVTFGANGVANVDYGATNLVTNNQAATLDVTQDADGLLQLNLGGVGPPVLLPNATGGTLGGLTASAVVTRSRLDSLDEIANQYVQDVNDWHTQGFSSPGVAGQTLLSIGPNAGTLSLDISNPALVAAQSADGVINGNLLEINSINGSGSFADKWTSLISTHGNLVNSTLAEQTAAADRDTMAQQARADVVGVNLDREAADLLRLQQAYQGSARVIQVAKELMDTIFSIF